MYFRVILLLSFSWTVVGADKQGSQMVTVGPTSDCDYSSIQAAINSNPDEIRVTDSGGNVFVENLLIENQNLLINGAFSDCTSASIGFENGFRSTIAGSTITGSLIQIMGDQQRYEVTIKNMSIESGDGQFGGGLAVLQADLQLALENVAFSGNTADSGGAIAVVGGDVNVQAIDLQISQNNANEGGGIYCSGFNNKLIFQDTGNPDVGIFSNSATKGDGGGVFLTEGCEFTSYMGSAYFDTFTDFRGINRNTATGKGGGVAVENGAKLYLKGYQECINGECIGNNQDAVTIGENQADGFGGGISAKGKGTLVEAYAFNIHSNNAISGAGISMEQNARLVTDNLYVNCWQPGACNQIINNKASFTGGAFYAQSGAELYITKTLFNRNRADLAVIASVWGNALLNIDSSIVAFNANNGEGGFNDEYLFNVFSGGLFNLSFSTIGNNFTPSAMIRNGGTRVQLIGSIIYDPDSSIYTTVTSGILNAECLVLSDDENITGTDILLEEPSFISAVSGDFHLLPNSPAIDLCAPDTLVIQDLDLNARGIDVPNMPNNEGPYDAGAYEFRPDLIFGNGFEILD